MRNKTDNLKKNLKPLKEFFSYYKRFWFFFFSVDQSCFCLKFLIDFLDEKWWKMLIMGHSCLIILGLNLSTPCIRYKNFLKFSVALLFRSMYHWSHGTECNMTSIFQVSHILPFISREIWEMRGIFVILHEAAMR